MNSPSRLRLRPPPRPAFRFRVRAFRCGFVLRRPVLGAEGNLCCGGSGDQGSAEHVFCAKSGQRSGQVRLEGKHVVVTGAGTGIGRAIAERLRAEGATLTLLARDRRRLDKVGRRLDARVEAVDIRERAPVTAAFDAASADRGPLHALVANAGVGGPNPGRARRPLRGARGHEPHRHVLVLPRGRAAARGRRATSSSPRRSWLASAWPATRVTVRRRPVCSGSSGRSPPSWRHAESR